MRNTYKLLASLVFMTATVAAEDYSAMFERYPTEQSYNGKIAKIDFSSQKGSWNFRTRLRNGIKEGPNFSNKFRIIEWGCGTSCTSGNIVDVETGKIVSDVDSCGLVDFRLSSKLVVFNPGASEDKSDYPEGCETTYFIFEKKQLIEISKDGTVIN